MSLIDNVDLIEIKLYYKYIKVGNNRKLVILEEKKAQEMLEDEEKAKGIEVLETKWEMLNWQEQNNVAKISSPITNTQTGEKQFDFIIYRDMMVKKCLKTWNMTASGQPIPVSPEYIDRLPGSIVADLHRRFETFLEYTEEELKN